MSKKRLWLSEWFHCTSSSGARPYSSGVQKHHLLCYASSPLFTCEWELGFWKMTQSSSENRMSPSLSLQKCCSRYLIFNCIKSKLHKFIKAEYEASQIYLSIWLTTVQTLSSLKNSLSFVQLSKKKHKGPEINKTEKKKAVLEMKQRWEITVQRKKENDRKQGKRDK